MTDTEREAYRRQMESIRSRQWTQIKSLTQEEVNRLPDGTAVVILWAGGNGPFGYTIRRKNGLVFAALEVGSVYDGLSGPLDHIGEHPRTQVWLTND